MEIKILQVGSIGTNCYIVSCKATQEAMILDPGGNTSAILAYVHEKNLNVKAIINTHGHMDHIAANDDLRRMLSAKLYIHQADASMLGSAEENLSLYIGQPFENRPADAYIKAGDTITIGKLSFAVLETPGHTKGGISLYGHGAVFSGDTLFYLSVGRTDFPGGSMRELLESIKTQLFTLPDDTVVYPGHGSATNIVTEKAQNPYIF